MFIDLSIDIKSGTT